jgi:hypothetical protein
MRNIIFTTVVFFFSFNFSFSQYSYFLKGQKEMVGKGQIRNYYGSEKIKTNCIFHSDYKSEKVQLLGDLFPQLGLSGKGLFYNFDKSGLAHIIELDGRVEVFQKGNCIYALACGNLLVFIEAFEKEQAPEKVSIKNNQNPPKRREEVLLPADQNFITIRQMKKHCWMKKSYGYPQEVECHGDGTRTGVVKTILEQDKYSFLDQTEIISRGSGRWTEVFWQL